MEKLERKVILKKEPKDSILSFCKMKHPNEALLILKGKSKKGTITVDGLTIPPFSYSDQTFAGFPQKDRKSTRLNSSHSQQSRMPSSA